MEELWQLFDDQGRPLESKGATKNDVYSKALLHAAAHIWIWRRNGSEIEILLQKRALDKRTWPGRYDISAAGHIDLGESELEAAIRETTEEIGHTPDLSRLKFIGAHRCYDVAPDKSWTENEFRFVYLLEETPDMRFTLDDGEVESVEWKDRAIVKQEIANDKAYDRYVPHGDAYFAILFEALERIADQPV